VNSIIPPSPRLSRRCQSPSTWLIPLWEVCIIWHWLSSQVRSETNERALQIPLPAQQPSKDRHGWPSVIMVCASASSILNLSNNSFFNSAKPRRILHALSHWPASHRRYGVSIHPQSLYWNHQY
jgi:hypothetical protein